ncbi:MAG: hypothetical protein LIP28_07515, partial [Deltaproteobacteria bacterium]|nr:hypothetical protein [Deltaproteobacteria bacterium]
MMPTRTNLRKPPARRLALAVGLIVFFAGLSALGLWDGFVPSPQGSRSASAASPENPSFQPTGHAPQTWYSQPEPEHALAGNAAVVPSAERAVPLSSQVSQGEKPVAGQEVALETAPQTPSPPPPVQPKELPAKEGLSWTPLIGRLASDGFDAPEMEKLFASLESPPLPEFMAQKAIELYGRYGKATLNVS